MKVLLGLALGVLLSTDAAAVITRGAPPCGAWAKEHGLVDKSWIAISQESWMMGYLSGVAVAQNVQILDDANNESLYLWVTNYCNAHPLDHVDDASGELAIELMRRKMPTKK